MSDLISRADAIEAVHEYYQKRFTEDSKWDADAKMLVLEDKTIAKDNMEICNIINTLPSADAVLRGRLINADALYKKATDLWDKSDSEDFEKGIFKLILNEPTVSADVAQGEWIKDYEKNIYKCSVCGCEEVVPTCIGEPTIWKYCPNCGSAISAKMKGGAE